MRLLVAMLALTLSILPAAAPPTMTITHRARSLQPGELVVLTIAVDSPVENIQVRAFGQDWPAYQLSSGSWQALVGIDLDTAPNSYTVTASAGTGAAAIKATHVLAVKSKAFETRTLTVDDAFVNPPASEAKRIQDEADRLNRIWRTSTPARLWAPGFVRPVTEEANSAFGKRSVFNGQPRSPHSGADFLSPAGTPVKAPNTGRVVLAGDLSYSGNTVIIDHGLGFYSLFAHFSSISVHEGDLVKPGQIVGKVGATGRVTGAHLHWAIRLAGARIDPLSVLALLGNS